LQKNFRSFLVAWGLLDDMPTPAPQYRIETNSSGERVEVKIEEKEGLWARMRPYFPIRQLSDEEWEEHKRKKDAAEDKARRAALQGVSDAHLDLDDDDSSKSDK
jgi:hypothetical protein